MSFYIKSGLTQLSFKEETTRGTYDAPQAADNNIRLHYDGMVSNETVKEMIGKLADGTFRDGRHYTRERILTLPEVSVEMTKATQPTDAPKWVKMAKACGYTEYTEDVTLNMGIKWSGQTECVGLSCLCEAYTCGSSPEGQTHKLRGIAGNMEIKAEGAQAPFVLAFSGLQGAWEGPADRASAAVNPLTGNDTAIAEMMGGYTTTIGAYTTPVYAYSFNPNSETSFIPANNDQGIAFFHTSGQGARLKVTVPVAKVADKDYVDNFFNNTIETSVTIAGGANSGYNMTHNGCEYVSCAYSDVQGVQCLEIEFNVLEDAIWVQK